MSRVAFAIVATALTLQLAAAAAHAQGARPLETGASGARPSTAVAASASVRTDPLKRSMTEHLLEASGLEVLLNYEGRMVLGEPIVVVANVRNAGTKPVTVQSVEVSASGSLAGTYPQPCQMTFSEQTLRPDERTASTCTLVPSQVKLSGLLFRQEQYQLIARIKVAARADPIPLPTSVKMAMPETSVVYGALAGVLLLVLFTSSYSYLAALPKAPEDLQTLRRNALGYLARLPIQFVLSLAELAIRAVQGAVVAIILIVLTRTTTDLQTPIVVKVEDFFGGLLVGIFSVPLSAWVATKVGLRDGGQTKP